MAEIKDLVALNKVHITSGNQLVLSSYYDDNDPNNIVEQFLSIEPEIVNFVDYIEGDGGGIMKNFPKETIEYINRNGDLILIDTQPTDYFIDGDGDLVFVEDMLLGKAFFEEGDNWTLATVNPQTNEFTGRLLNTQTSAAAATWSMTFDGFVLTQGVSYDVQFTVNSVTGGNVNIDLGGTNGTSRSTAATFSEVVVCGAGGVIKIEGGMTSSTNFIEISDLIIKEA